MAAGKNGAMSERAIAILKVLDPLPPMPDKPDRIRSVVGAPRDGAEARVAEEVVGERDGLHRLVPVAQVGGPEVAARDQVLDAEGVRTPEAHREAHAAAQDYVLAEVAAVHPGLPVRAGPGHVVLAARGLEHRPVAED